MFESLRRRLMQSVAKEEEVLAYVPVEKDGKAMISDLEQIPETYCDISSKDYGERYLGLRTDTIYVMVNPWELDG